MRCHVCGEPAIGQCQACWKFYCARHGDVFCASCQEQRKTAGAGWNESARVVAFHDQGSSPAHRARPTPPPDLDAQPIQRVIGVSQSTKHGGTELELISLELYADGFIAHFRLRSGKLLDAGPSGGFGRLPHFIPAPPPHPEYTPDVVDDRGNRYAAGPRGGGGGRSSYRATFHVYPAPPSEARRLEFTVTEIRWMAHGPGQRSVIETGPWTFHVDL